MNFHFIVHTAQHVRIIAGAARALRDSGHGVHTIDLYDIDGSRRTQDVTDECRRLAMPSRPTAWLRANIAAADCVVTCCDWNPAGLVRLLEDLRGRGHRIVGVIEGCRWGAPERFRHVDRVLAYGQAARRAFTEPVHVVGSPVIEETLAARPSARSDRRYALINYKDLQRESSPALEAWLGTVLRTCAASGVEGRVSLHPRMRSGPAKVAVADESFAQLIHGAALLVSMSSTVILEALACGKPVILFPYGSRPLLEFAEPQGAFEIATSEEELSRAIAAALSPAPARGERARAFLEDQVSIDPARPAWRRMADALEQIATDPAWRFPPRAAVAKSLRGQEFRQRDRTSATGPHRLPAGQG